MLYYTILMGLREYAICPYGPAHMPYARMVIYPYIFPRELQLYSIYIYIYNISDSLSLSLSIYIYIYDYNVSNRTFGPKVQVKAFRP